MLFGMFCVGYKAARQAQWESLDKVQAVLP